MENGRKAWKENLTVPNILSVLRILLIIPFVFFFLSKNYIAAAAMVIISGLSDMFDGMIAQKFNQITALGKILDPIADKLTLVAVIICIGIIVPKIIPLVVILVVKDLLMLLGGAYLIQKKITPPAAKWYGKLSTILFYLSVSVIVLLEIITGSASDFAVLTTVLMLVTTAAMLFSMVKYFLIFLSLLRENKQEGTANRKAGTKD